jgi:cytochrome c oxidase subunit IV
MESPTTTAPGQIAKPQTKAIWRTFWILCVATAIEFIIAFSLPAGTIRIAIFLGLTVIKAFYIVGEFMHLKNEQKTLIWSIVLPSVFIMWAIAVFLIEGGSILQVR